MKLRFALITTTAIALAPSAFATTVTANFSVDNQSIFGSGSASDFSGSAGIGNNSSTFQFSASTSASSGTVDSDATIGLNLNFESQVAASDAGNVGVGLSFGSLVASFDTALGAAATVGGTIRTPSGNVTIPVPFFPDTVIPVSSTSVPFSLIDEDYLLDAERTDTSLSFGQVLTATDAVALTGAETPRIPIATPTASATLNVTQSSDLTLTEVTGTLKATNAVTGAMVTEAFSFAGGALDFGLDLSEAGFWDLELIDLALGSSFGSNFGLSTTLTAGVAVEVTDPLGIFEVGCGDPSTDAGNGILCFFDEGISQTFPNPPLNLLPIDAFTLNFNQIDSLSAGRIEVLAAPSAVPLPAGVFLMLGGLGAFGAVGARRKAKQA